MKSIIILFISVFLAGFFIDGNNKIKPKKAVLRTDSTSRNTPENNIKPDVAVIIDRDSTYTQVEQKAFFPGGEVAVQKYINRFLVQPKPRRSVTIKVKFVVERYGAVTKVHVIEGEEFAEESNEAIRVIHSMLAWEPAKIKGTAVASHNEMVIQFGKR